MKYKIEFDKTKCSGCGACTVCDNWEIGDDGFANPKKTKLEIVDCNKEVADNCPSGAIKIVEIK